MRPIKSAAVIVVAGVVENPRQLASKWAGPRFRQM
jgi:hypothetical protein